MGKRQKMNRIIFVLAAILLFGCGNQAAIDEATAYRIRVETDQQVLTNEQTRVANEELAKQKAIDDAYWNAVFSSALYTVKQITVFVVYSIGIALCVIIMGSGWTIKETAIGLGQARVARAQLEACLIHMDENTRTFPAFAIRNVNGSQFITMLATGQTFKLNKPIDANPLLVAALAQVSTTGVYAREASKVAMVRGNEVQPFDPTVITGVVADPETKLERRKL